MNGMASAVLAFGVWVAVTPETMTRPLPEFEHSTPPSAPRYVKSTPLPEACALYENGRRVGYSLNCEQSPRTARDLPTWSKPNG